MILDKLQTSLESAHQEVTGKQAAPDILAMLMDLVMSLLGGCLPARTSADVVTTLKDRPVIARVAIRQAGRKLGIQIKSEHVETIMKAGDFATTTDLDAINTIDFVM